MANRRVQKKRSKRIETSIAHAAGESRSLYQPRGMVVSVPCPSCARPTLNRVYVPAMGSMNGTVECGACGYDAPYVEALKRAMDPVDPLPGQFYSRRVRETAPVPERSFWKRIARWFKRPEGEPAFIDLGGPSRVGQVVSLG